MFDIQSKEGHCEVIYKLLRGGADPDIVSNSGSAREIAECEWFVDVVLTIDRHKCRTSLVDLCLGMYGADLPVLVVLEIHQARCALARVHEAELGRDRERVLLPIGHVNGIVAWDIAKTVKHYFN